MSNAVRPLSHPVPGAISSLTGNFFAAYSELNRAIREIFALIREIDNGRLRDACHGGFPRQTRSTTRERDLRN
jgi:hypothetical protein